MRKLRKRVSVAVAAVGAVVGGVVAIGQEPAGAPPSQETPVSDRDAEARQDVAVLGEEPRSAEERVENALDAVERRDEILGMADAALERLRAENAAAIRLLDRAYGHAVFDTTKGGLIVTGAGGTGVARVAESDEKTFMHVGAGGIGVGGGFENYKLVMLFEDAEVYDAFVAGQWDGSISAQAAAGDDGAAAEEQFVDGIRVYRLTDAGFIAQVDVSGMRFWPSEELNDPRLEQ